MLVDIIQVSILQLAATFIRAYREILTWGSNPIFAHGKMCVFPFFSHGGKWEKSIWKEREMNTFPSLSIYFFPIFPYGEKWENTHFSMGKNGIGPSPLTYTHDLLNTFTDMTYISVDVTTARIVHNRYANDISSI